MNRKWYGLVIWTLLFVFNAGLITAQSHKAVLIMAEKYRPPLQSGDTVVIQCRPIFIEGADKSGEVNAQRIDSTVENNIMLICLAVGDSEESIRPFKTNVEITGGVLDLETRKRNTGSANIWNKLNNLGYVSYEKPYIITSVGKFYTDLTSQRLMPNDIGNEPVIFQMTVEVVSYDRTPPIPILTFKDAVVDAPVPGTSPWFLVP